MGLFVFPQRGSGEEYISLTYAAGPRLAVGARISEHASLGRGNYDAHRDYSLQHPFPATFLRPNVRRFAGRFARGLGGLLRFDGGDKCGYFLTRPPMVVI